MLSEMLQFINKSDMPPTIKLSLVAQVYGGDLSFAKKALEAVRSGDCRYMEDRCILSIHKKECRLKKGKVCRFFELKDFTTNF